MNMQQVFVFACQKRRDIALSVLDKYPKILENIPSKILYRFGFNFYNVCAFYCKAVRR